MQQRELCTINQPEHSKEKTLNYRQHLQTIYMQQQELCTINQPELCKEKHSTTQTYEIDNRQYNVD